MDSLRDLAHEYAAGAAPTEPCHWIYGANESRAFGIAESNDYCRECADTVAGLLRVEYPQEAEQAGLQVDGGWGTDHDSPPFCEGCGVRLLGSLTDYGVTQELDHFENYPPRLGDADAWAMFDEALDSLAEGDPRWEQAETAVTASLRIALLTALTRRAEVPDA